MLNESPSVSVCCRGSAHPGNDPLRTVVWVRGHHDVATREHLSLTVAQAACLDDADVVVDLSGVTFMDASTIGTIVGAHNRLRARSRSLCIRAPSVFARRLLDVCELTFLIDDEPPAVAQPPSAAALNSWVTVPATDRTSDSTQPPVTGQEPSHQPAHPTAQQPVELAVSAQQRLAPS